MSRKKPKQGTRKSEATARRDARIRREEGALRLRRIAFWLAVFMVIAFGFAAFLSLERMGAVQERLVNVSRDAGFTVKTVSVEGRVYSDAADILKALGAEEGMPLLAFEPSAARENLEKLSWVKAAKVERRWPDTIYVELTERTPLALWQKDKELALIDPEGAVITRHDLGRFGDLKVVTGEEAPRQAAALLALLKGAPVLDAQVEAASWTGGRRWNLKTVQGIIVKLPEEDIGLALGRLVKLEGEEGILHKGIDQIDLRDPSRIVVRTKPGELKSYPADFSPATGKKGDI